MNIFQIIIQLLGGGYSQDEVIAMILLKYKQNTGNSIAYATIRRCVLSSIGDYNTMSLNMIDTLTDVAGCDIRAAIETKLKEIELV